MVPLPSLDKNEAQIFGEQPWDQPIVFILGTINLILKHKKLCTCQPDYKHTMKSVPLYGRDTFCFFSFDLHIVGQIQTNSFSQTPNMQPYAQVLLSGTIHL